MSEWIADYCAECLRTTGWPVSVSPASRGLYVVTHNNYSLTVTRKKIEAFTAVLRLRPDAEPPRD